MRAQWNQIARLCPRMLSAHAAMLPSLVSFVASVRIQTPRSSMSVAAPATLALKPTAAAAAVDGAPAAAAAPSSASSVTADAPAGASTAASGTVASFCESFVISPDASAHSSALTSLILALHARRTHLPVVVQSLGAFLVSSTESHRRRSVLLLSELLARIPALGSDVQAWRTLLGFFMDKLKDECAWKEALMGINALLKRTTPGVGEQNETTDAPTAAPAVAAPAASGPVILRPEDVVAICGTLFDRVSVQSMAQSGRALAFQLLWGFVGSHPAALVSMGDAAVSGIVTSIDGEKDPRNLILTFKLARFILVGATQMPLPGASAAGSDSVSARSGPVSFPAPLLAPYLEDIFLLSSCYFPITFTPPKHDTVGITSADLKAGLNSVLAASGAMAEWVLAFLLEKSESAVAEAKIDAFDTLGECIRSTGYSVQQIDPFLSAIGDAVRKELLGLAAGAASETPNEAVHAAAARLLATLTRRFAPDSVAGFPSFDLAPSWSLLLGPLLDSIGVELLDNPESKSARNHAAMWVLIASATVNAFTRSMTMLFPAVERKFGACAEGIAGSTQRLALLELMGLLVAAARQSYAEPIPQHPLQPYAESMMSLASSVLLSGASASAATAAAPAESVVATTATAAATGSVEPRAAGVEILGGLAALPSFRLIKHAPSKAADAAAAAAAASAASSSSSAVSFDSPSEHRLLSPAQVQLVVSTLTARLLSDDAELVRSKALQGLVQIGAIPGFDRIVLEHTIPALFSAHNVEAASNATAAAAVTASGDGTMLDAPSTASSSSLEVILDSASALCISPALLDAILPHLLSMLRAHFSPSAATAPTNAAAEDEAVHLLLGSINEIVQSNASSEAGRLRLTSSIPVLSQALIALLIQAVAHAQSSNGRVDSKLVQSIVHIVQSLTRAASAEGQQALAQDVLALFLDGRTAPFVSAGAPAFEFRALPKTAEASLQPSSIPDAQLQMVPLLTAVIGSLRREVLHKVLTIDCLQRAVALIDSAAVAAAVAGSCPAPSLASQAMVELVASALNKLDVADARFTWCLDYLRGLFEFVTANARDGTGPDQVAACRRKLAPMLWGTKALLMRNHPAGVELTGALIQLLAPSAAFACSPLLAESVARGLGLLLHDSPSVLNRESFAQCGPGLLYKQRFFVQQLPQIMKMFEDAPSIGVGAAADASASASVSVSAASAASAASSPRYVILLALAHVLQHVPHAVLLESSSRVLPLLLQSLAHPAAELRVASLHTLSLLLREDVGRMQPHLHTMLPVITELLGYKQSMVS